MKKNRISTGDKLVIDILNEQFCNGWYSSENDENTGFSMTINGIETIQVHPTQERYDVFEAKAGKLLSGFHIDFPKRLKPCDEIEFKSGTGARLEIRTIPARKDYPPRLDHALLCEVEPFVEFDVDKTRLNLIDTNVIEQYERLTTEALAAVNPLEFKADLIRLVAEIRTDIHYLKAAYIESTRYHDPNFEIDLPKPEPKLARSEIIIDMRGDITGGNWHLADQYGRWAGPENQSSVLVPALSPGRYQMDLEVVSEIVPGVLDSTTVSVNGVITDSKCRSPGFPTCLESTFEIPETYKFPFWIIKFDFQQLGSPADSGGDDQRTLAISIKTLHLTKLEV